MAAKNAEKCPIENFDMCSDKCNYCRHYIDERCQYPEKKRK